MKKNYLRRNKWNIVVFLLVIIVSILSFKYKIIETENIDKDFHFNILTINSLFAGFLYTSLGIMASIMDKERIARLDKAGYMDNYYNGIYMGLFFHIISIIIAVLSILITKLNFELLVITEQLSMLAGIIFFIKSVANILKIIGKVRYG